MVVGRLALPVDQLIWLVSHEPLCVVSGVIFRLRTFGTARVELYDTVNVLVFNFLFPVLLLEDEVLHLLSSIRRCLLKLIDPSLEILFHPIDVCHSGISDEPVVIKTILTALVLVDQLDIVFRYLCVLLRCLESTTVVSEVLCIL